MNHNFIFYLEPEDISGNQVTFNRSESHHLNVLRLQSGGEVEAVDGRGNGYIIRLGTKRDRLWRGEILNSRCIEPRFPLPVWLALPGLKGDRWESALEAACELGIQGVWLTDYRNSAVSWTPARQDKAKRKAIEALKQSGGYKLTEISDPVTLTVLLEKNIGQSLYVADNDGAVLSEMHTPALILVGPEAGLHSEERDLIRAHEGLAFTLGRRRLRSEIACIASLAQASLKLTESN